MTSNMILNVSSFLSRILKAEFRFSNALLKWFSSIKERMIFVCSNSRFVILSSLELSHDMI